MSVVEELEATGGNIGNWTDGELEELKADAYRLQGRYDEAEQILKEELRIHPGHARAHYALGQLYEEMNRREDAAREYERFLEMWSGADEGLPQLTVAEKRLAVFVEQE